MSTFELRITNYECLPAKLEIRNSKFEIRTSLHYEQALDALLLASKNLRFRLEPTLP
jgi:hypothetical protein